MGRGVGRVAVLLLGIIRGRATSARATDRRRSATAEALLCATPLGVPTRRPRQAPEAMVVAACACDPGVAPSSVALVMAGPVSVAAVLPSLLVQVPVVPLAVLATGLLPALTAGALTGASRVAGRACAVRKRVAPRAVSGVGAPLSAVEAGSLRLVTTL